MEHLLHLFGGESQHIVELFGHGYIFRYVETAGQVIERHRADAGQDDALEDGFKLLKYIAIETVGMSDFMVYIVSFGSKNGICKIVVFIHQEAQSNLVIVSCTALYHFKFIGKPVGTYNQVIVIFIVILLVSLHKLVYSDTTMLIKLLPHIFYLPAYHGEIEG
jgi:hypothetical protein